MWTKNFQMFKLRKDRGTRNQISNIRWIIEKAKKKKIPGKKKSTFVLLITPKSLTVWITTNCGKFFKRLKYQTTLPASWEIYTGEEATVGTRHGTDWFQIGKWVHKAAYCHLADLTYMQSTSCETLGCMKHKMESRLLKEISKTSDMQMTQKKWQT